MATPIAELFVSVSADVSAAQAGLSSLSNQLNSTSNSFRNAAPAALAFEAAGAAVFGGLVSSVKVAADFEQQMANVRAVLDPSEAENFGGAIEDLALTLGRDTVFTSAQAANAIGELVKAGVPVEDILSGAARGAVNLAAATGVSTTEAATVASQALNAFGLQGKDATAIMDRLAGVANASASDISFLRFGMAASAAVAHQVGLSFDDTAVALGLLSNQFANGSDAGTSFKQFLASLTPNSKAAEKEMRALGLITADGRNQFFDATGSIKSFAQIQQVLHNALAKLTPLQRQQALETIFGSDAGRAAAAIYGLNAEQVRKFATETGRSGIVQEQAETRLNTLEGSLQNLGGSIEVLQNAIGKTFLPPLRQLADLAKDLVDRFSTLNPSVRQGIVTFALIGAAVLTALGAFILFYPAISVIPAALSAVAGVLLTMAPLIAIVAGAFLLIKSAVDRNIGPVKALTDAFGNIGDIIQAAFAGDISGAIAGFLEDLSTLDPGIRQVISNVRTAFQNFFDFIQPVLTIIGVAIDQAFQGNFGGAIDILRGMANQFLPVEDAIKALKNVSDELNNFWNDPLKPTIAAIQDAVEKLRPKLDDLATGFAGVVVPPALNFFNLVLDTLTKMRDQTTSDNLGGFFSALGTALSTFGNQLASLSPVFEAISNLFGSVFNLFGTIAQIGTTAALGVFTNVLAPGFDALAASMTPFSAALAPIILPFRLFVELVERLSAQPELMQKVADVINAIATAINNLATALQNLPPLPAFLQPGGENAIASGAVAGPGTVAAAAGLPTPTQAQEAGGSLITIGQLIISSEAEATAFLDRVGQAIATAAKRASTPTDNSANPALAVGT